MKFKQITWTKLDKDRYEGHIGMLLVFEIIKINSTKEFFLHGTFGIEKMHEDIEFIKDYAQKEIERYIKMFII